MRKCTWKRETLPKCRSTWCSDAFHIVFIVFHAHGRDQGPQKYKTHEHSKNQCEAHAFLHFHKLFCIELTLCSYVSHMFFLNLSHAPHMSSYFPEWYKSHPSTWIVLGTWFWKILCVSPLNNILYQALSPVGQMNCSVHNFLKNAFGSRPEMIYWTSNSVGWMNGCGHLTLKNVVFLGID